MHSSKPIGNPSSADGKTNAAAFRKTASRAIPRSNPREHRTHIAACGLAEALHVRVCVATFAESRQLVCSVDVSISEHQIFYSFLGHKSSDISYVLSWYQPEAAEACTVGLGVFRPPLYAVRYVDSCAVVCPLEIGLEVARDNDDLIRH